MRYSIDMMKCASHRFGACVFIISVTSGGLQSCMSFVSDTAFDHGDILEFEYLTALDGSKRVFDIKSESDTVKWVFGVYIWRLHSLIIRYRVSV